MCKGVCMRNALTQQEKGINTITGEKHALLSSACRQQSALTTLTATTGKM